MGNHTTPQSCALCTAQLTPYRKKNNTSTPRAQHIHATGSTHLGGFQRGLHFCEVANQGSFLIPHTGRSARSLEFRFAASRAQRLLRWGMPPPPPPPPPPPTTTTTHTDHNEHSTPWSHHAPVLRAAPCMLTQAGTRGGGRYLDRALGQLLPFPPTWRARRCGA